MSALFFISRSKSLSPFFSLSFAGLPPTFSFSLSFSCSILQICGHDNLSKLNTLDNTDTETIFSFRFRLYWLFCCLCFTRRRTLWFPAKMTSNCIWVTIPVDWVILHWYACGAEGRSLGRAGGRCTVTWLPNFLGWVDYFIFLPIVLRWRASRARAPLKSGFWLILKFHRGPYLKFQIHFKELSTTTSLPSFSAESVALVKKIKSVKNNRLDDIWHSTLRPTDDKCKCLEWFDVFLTF